MADNDGYSGGPSSAGIERSYRKAGRRGTATPADERSGGVIDGDVYSSADEYRKSRAANRGMKQGLHERAQARKDRDSEDESRHAGALEARDTGLIRELTKRGSRRLTVRGRRRTDRR